MCLDQSESMGEVFLKFPIHHPRANNSGEVKTIPLPAQSFEYVRVFDTAIPRVQETSSHLKLTEIYGASKWPPPSHPYADNFYNSLDLFVFGSFNNGIGNSVSLAISFWHLISYFL